MMQLSINGKIYNVPTNFDEVSYKDYCKLLTTENTAEKINILTEIPIEIISELSISDIHFITECLMFADILFVAQNYAGLSEPLHIDIGASTYGQLEIARQNIVAKGWIAAGNEVMKAYELPEINDLVVPLAMSYLNDIYGKINTFLEKYKKLFEGEPDLEEELAGAEVFAKFGSFPTIDKLAIEYGISHDDVLKMPAEIVYTKLLYEHEKNEFETKLHKIKSKSV
jgi:hypothetical protein